MGRLLTPLNGARTAAFSLRDFRTGHGPLAPQQAERRRCETSTCWVEEDGVVGAGPVQAGLGARRAVLVRDTA